MSRADVMDEQRVIDDVEITGFLTRYIRAVDGKDWDLYRSLFTDDAHVDYSAAGFVVGTADDAVAFFRRYLDDAGPGMHYVTNVEADVDGDRARVIAMWHNASQRPGSTTPRFFGGRWRHDLVRTADGWRSRNLLLEVTW